MLYNYLKVALRYLYRHRTYTAINIFGLAVGITCCLVILLFIRDELSYDRFHEQADQSYRLLSEFEESRLAPVTSAPVAPTIAREYPDIEHVTRVFRHWRKPLLAHKEHAALENNFLFADSAFFEVFSFPLLEGDPGTALRKPFSIVLSESMAHKYFGHEDPMGKTVSYNAQQEFTITGIMQDVPSNTHVHPDFLASLSSLPQILWPTILDMWSFNNFYTYVVLEESASPASFESKLSDLYSRHIEGGSQTTLHLQPLTDIHLQSQLTNEIEANSDIRYIYLLSAIGLLILFMACINYINLAIARSASRAREAGMRKVVGAQRIQLVQQFMGESFLLSVLAVLLAIGLASLVLPVVNNLTSKQLALRLNDWWIIAGVLGIMLAANILAGSYPALMLSRFRPVEVLKGKIYVGESAFLRKGLVTFQVAASVALVIGTFVIFKQLDYVQTTQVGFNKEQVVILPIQDPEVQQRYEAFHRALLLQPGVVAVGAGNAYPGTGMPSGDLWWEGQAENESAVTYATWVDDGYLEALEIELAAGRGFSAAFQADENAVLLNESAVNTIGWASPEEALGKIIRTSADSRSDLQVIGVVKDYHFESLHSQIEPLVLYAKFADPSHVLVRIRSDRMADMLASIKKTWDQFSASQPFLYSFLDEDFDQLYRADEQWGQVMSYAALIAILIGCLGLFSLAAFTANQRTREIGVRKVLGASVGSLAYLVARDFFKLVSFGFILAIPVSYYAMSRWLENFAYRTEIGLSVFLLAGIMTCLVVLLTVSSQSIRAALADPVKSLRQE